LRATWMKTGIITATTGVLFITPEASMVMTNMKMIVVTGRAEIWLSA